MEMTRRPGLRVVVLRGGLAPELEEE